VNAAELDRYLVAERAYNKAVAEGRSEEEARWAAVQAVDDKRTEEFLDRIGVPKS
jgi:nitrogen fixation protein FixH